MRVRRVNDGQDGRIKSGVFFLWVCRLQTAQTRLSGGFSRLYAEAKSLPFVC